ncbi:uncharacterized protein EV420DRAFT_982829 [Desarmillaria tabescens]|uniref:Uncharacterized protein n=1 Tax=Armillaria tabescens TaxID=1929756 RepID=A0AA39JM34_ARMTA|nr:uncharacterized protein EV420DRAFT_982829 [Desarmillaria tabescens]KAK0445034.1 hypothetical protein EV420DRAFT_982829 [Desarmillaria tabescens]
MISAIVLAASAPTFCGNPGSLEFLDSFASKLDGWSHDLFPGLATFNTTINYAEENKPYILNSLINIVKTRWKVGTSCRLRSLSLDINGDDWADSDVEDEFRILQQFKASLDVPLKRNATSVSLGPPALEGSSKAEPRSMPAASPKPARSLLNNATCNKFYSEGKNESMRVARSIMHMPQACPLCFT